MKVGMFYVKTHGFNEATRVNYSPMAARMIASVHRTMPGVPVVQLTNFLTEPFPDVDVVKRLDFQPERSSVGRLFCHMTAQQDGDDWLFLDTDVIVQRDVREVWQQSFDIAIAERPADPQAGEAIVSLMPYNNGVMFSRSSEFWRLAITALHPLMPAWYADQYAINQAIATMADECRIVFLSSTYNYTPASPVEDISAHAIVHYKGDRKSWLVGGRRWNVLERWVKEHAWWCGAEIGVESGRLFTYLLRTCPGLTLYGVDLFEPRPGLEREGGRSHEHARLPEQEQKLRRLCDSEFHGRGFLLKGYSTEMAKTILDGSLDFVFIDADHREAAVREDIMAWHPKVRPGGMLTGHDYQAKFPGVMAVVDELFPHRTVHEDSVWGVPVR